MCAATEKQRASSHPWTASDTTYKEVSPATPPLLLLHIRNIHVHNDNTYHSVLTNKHTPGNGRPCWASSGRLPSMWSYPGPAGPYCCCQSQTILRGKETGELILDNFILHLENNMQDRGQPCSKSLCRDLWKYSCTINQISSAGSTAFGSNNSLWLWLYTLLDAFCHLLYCSLRLVELHEGNWPFAKEITIFQRAGEGKGWK